MHVTEVTAVSGPKRGQWWTLIKRRGKETMREKRRR